MISQDNSYIFIEEPPSRQRGAYRASVQGLNARAEEQEHSYAINDISNTGFSMNAPAEHFPVGSRLCIHIDVKQNNILNNLHATVVRITPEGLVACAFQDVPPQQETILDKLILEIQKREIRLAKKGKRAGTPPHTVSHNP